MSINRDKPDRWKADIAESVDMYNDWFLAFAPKAFRETRVQTTKDVEDTLRATANLTNVSPQILRQEPGVLPTLRMSTCPPIARDRLVNLAYTRKSMVERMEKEGKLPTQLTGAKLDEELRKVGAVIERLADRDIFTWLDAGRTPTDTELQRAASIVADRLCGATTDPIIRNAQEARQLARIGTWLKERGYTQLRPGAGTKFNAMPPGTYSFRMTFIRPILPTANVHHHAPVSAQGGVNTGNWFAMEFAAPDRTKAWAVISRLGVNRGEPDVFQFHPRGLDVAATYAVTFDSFDRMLDVSGVDLMQDGLSIRLESNLSSELLLFEAH